jgi:hypothetical protein
MVAVDRLRGEFRHPAGADAGRLKPSASLPGSVTIEMTRLSSHFVETFSSTSSVRTGTIGRGFCGHDAPDVRWSQVLAAQ